MEKLSNGKPTYLDSFRIHEAVIDGVDGVILADVAVALQQDWSSVEAVVGPKDAEPASLVAFDEGPTGVIIWQLTTRVKIGHTHHPCFKPPQSTVDDA